MSQLSPYKNNPRYFKDPAGFPVYLCGVDATAELLQSDASDHAFFRELARHDVNAIRLDLDAIDCDPSAWISPYKRSKGTSRTVAGFRRFNLSAQNPAYWERLAALVRNASANNIYIFLSFFNDPTTTPQKWAASAWNPANNVNGEDLGVRFAYGDAEAISCALYAAESFLNPPRKRNSSRNASGHFWRPRWN